MVAVARPQDSGSHLAGRHARIGGSLGPAMKILLAHNYYQLPGGEDVVFEQERLLLERMGHQVITYTRSNLEIESARGIGRAGLLKTIVYAHDSRDYVAAILKRERPDVVHVHNTLMMISPSIFAVCSEYGIPTVQT